MENVLPVRMTATIEFSESFTEPSISSIQRSLNLPITLKLIILAFFHHFVSHSLRRYHLQNPQNDNQMRRIMIPSKPAAEHFKCGDQLYKWDIG